MRNWLNAIYYISRKIYFRRSIEIMNIYVTMYISWSLIIVFVSVHSNRPVVACIAIHKSLLDATLRLLTSALIVILEIRGAAGSRGSRWLSFSFLKQWQYQWQFMILCSSMPIYTYVYGAGSLTRVHLSSVIQLTQICIMYSIITMYALPFPMASMPAVRYDLNGGIPTYLWYDSLYIRIIW